VLAEYDEVLRRPRLKLQQRQIDEALAAIRKVANLVAPAQTLSVSADESDNRFLECAEAAEADYLVTGISAHPQNDEDRHRTPVLGYARWIGEAVKVFAPLVGRIAGLEKLSALKLRRPLQFHDRVDFVRDQEAAISDWNAFIKQDAQCDDS
jgi:hypothetical protein